MPSVHERLARALSRHAGLRVFRLFRRALDPATPATLPGGVAVRMLGEGDLARVCHRPELDLQHVVETLWTHPLLEDEAALQVSTRKDFRDGAGRRGTCRP